jgi:hypothetical protein
VHTLPFSKLPLTPILRCTFLATWSGSSQVMGATQGLCGNETATASSSMSVHPGVGSEMAATTGMIRRCAKYCTTQQEVNSSSSSSGALACEEKALALG